MVYLRVNDSCFNCTANQKVVIPSFKCLSVFNIFSICKEKWKQFLCQLILKTSQKEINGVLYCTVKTLPVPVASMILPESCVNNFTLEIGPSRSKVSIFSIPVKQYQNSKKICINTEKHRKSSSSHQNAKRKMKITIN